LLKTRKERNEAKKETLESLKLQSVTQVIAIEHQSRIEMKKNRNALKQKKKSLGIIFIMNILLFI